jgi:hypothetical protein
MVAAFWVIAIAILSFFFEALMVMWFFWALHDVGYLSHSLDLGQSCTVALPIWVASLFGIFGSKA